MSPTVYAQEQLSIFYDSQDIKVLWIVTWHNDTYARFNWFRIYPGDKIS